VENKKLKHPFKQRRGFALFITIILIAILFLLSYSIVQSNLFQSNLNKLKYMNLQANIHYEYVEKYINEHSDEEIEKLTLNDNRFNLKVSSEIDNNSTTYYIIIDAKDDIPIRLSKKIIK